MKRGIRRMCGIVGYIGRRPALPVVLDGLKRLEYRGYGSAGGAVTGNGRVGVTKTEGRIATLIEKLAREGAPETTVGIGHTRWATHGRPSDANAHPHTDCHGKVAVVHNGIIENYLVLRQRLKDRGHRFRSETDTEVIPHLIEEYYAGDLAEAARRALATLWGEAADAVDLVDTPAPEAVGARGVDPAETLDARLARAERRTAEAVIDRERAAARPDLTVQAGVRRFQQNGDAALVVGVSAPIPVFNRNQGAVAAARADAAAAEARERLALARSIRTLRDAQASLVAANARVEALRGRILPGAETAVDLARRGFEAGKFSLLDVLDAQTALTTARTDLIAARLERAKALAALERAAAQ